MALRISSPRTRFTFTMANNLMMNLGDYEFTEKDLEKLGELMKPVAKDGGYKNLRVRFAVYLASNLTQEEVVQAFMKFNARAIYEEGRRRPSDEETEA